MSDTDPIQVTLYNEDAEWFRDVKERVTERRNGHEPSNAELMRMMLTQYDPTTGGLG